MSRWTLGAVVLLMLSPAIAWASGAFQVVVMGFIVLMAAAVAESVARHRRRAEPLDPTLHGAQIELPPSIDGNYDYRHRQRADRNRGRLSVFAHSEGMAEVEEADQARMQADPDPIGDGFT